MKSRLVSTLALATLLQGHTAGVTSLQFLPDNKLLSASLDGTLRVWDLASGHATRIMRHGAEVYTVIVVDDTHAVSSGGDRRIVLWDLQRGAATKSVRFPSRCISAAKLSANQIVVGCSDARLRILQLPNLTTEREIKTPTEVFAVAVSPDHRRIASSLPVRIWDAETGKAAVENVRSFGQGGVAYSADGAWLASGEWTGGVRIFKAATGESVSRSTSADSSTHYGPAGFTKEGVLMPIAAIAFTPDGNNVIAGSARRVVESYRTASPQDNPTTIGKHSATVTAVAVRSDGLIASGSLDKTIRLWR